MDVVLYWSFVVLSAATAAANRYDPIQLPVHLNHAWMWFCTDHLLCLKQLLLLLPLRLPFSKDRPLLHVGFSSKLLVDMLGP